MEVTSDENVSSTSGSGERNVVAEGYYAIDNDNGDIYNPGFGQGGDVGGGRIHRLNDGESVGDGGDGQGRRVRRRVDDGNNDNDDDDDDDDDSSMFTSDEEEKDEEDEIDTGEICGALSFYVNSDRPRTDICI